MAGGAVLLGGALLGAGCIRHEAEPATHTPSTTATPSSRAVRSSSTVSPPTTQPSAPEASTTTSHPQLAAPQGEQLGIAMGSSLYGLDSGELDEQFGRIVDLGVRHFRHDIDWSMLQPKSKDAYNWSEVDAIMEGAKRHRLGMLAVLAYTPPWARAAGGASEKAEPRDPAEYAAVAEAVAKRYHGNGVLRGIEIGNEVNDKAFWEKPSAERYARVLNLGAQAIHGVAPELALVSAGLQRGETETGHIAPAEFVDTMLTELQRLKSPIFPYLTLGYHPYEFPGKMSQNNPWGAVAQLAGPVQPSIKDVLRKHNLATMPVMFTEAGAPTGGQGPTATLTDQNFERIATQWEGSHADEAFQAALIDEFLSHQIDGVAITGRYVHTLQDAVPPGASADRESYFGLFRRTARSTYEPKPAADVVRRHATGK